MTSLCDNSNPNAAMAEKLYGISGAGLFGYSHLFGGYAGRPGAVRPRALCRCGSDEGTGEHQRRTGACS